MMFFDFSWVGVRFKKSCKDVARIDKKSDNKKIDGIFFKSNTWKEKLIGQNKNKNKESGKVNFEKICLKCVK